MRVPGPEILARPACLLLELSGATLADVMTARMAIEPPAAKLLANEGSDDAHRELARIVSEVPAAWAAGRLAAASANLHRRVVELSGNTTLGLLAGTLHEIAARHGAAAEGHWRRHLENSAAALLKGYETTTVRDILL